MNEHTSWELSERLYEKGFRGEHRVVWVERGDCDFSLKKLCNCDNCSNRNHGHIPAYTFSELWAVVPIKIKDSLGKWQYLEMRKHVPKPSFSSIAYTNHALAVCEVYFNHESPAEAMGLLVEWLLDNSYIEREG